KYLVEPPFTRPTIGTLPSGTEAMAPLIGLLLSPITWTDAICAALETSKRKVTQCSPFVLMSPITTSLPTSFSRVSLPKKTRYAAPTTSAPTMHRYPILRVDLFTKRWPDFHNVPLRHATASLTKLIYTRSGLFAMGRMRRSRAPVERTVLPRI